MTTSHNEVRSYLLGRLDDETAANVEHRMFTDDAYFQEVRDEIDELCEAFLSDTLPAHDRVRVASLVTAPPWNERLELSRALRKIAERMPRAELVSGPAHPVHSATAPEMSFARRPARRRYWRASLATLAIASVVVIVAVRDRDILPPELSRDTMTARAAPTAPGAPTITTSVEGEGRRPVTSVETTSAAQTLDFAEFWCLSGPGGAITHASPLRAQGYTLESHAFLSVHFSRSTFATWCLNSAGHFSGSAAMFAGPGGAFVVVKREGGGPFAIKSVDLGPLYSHQIGPVSIVFTALRQDGTTTSQVFSFRARSAGETDPNTHLALERFHFNSSFQNVIEVVWRQGANDLHQFDNIALGPAVP